MEKKVRYLMLLLCLFLFPMKAFALEEVLDGTRNEEIKEEVVTDNFSNNENLEDVEDLVKIDDPDTVLLEKKDSNEQAGKELTPADDSTDVVTTDPVEKNLTKNVGNVENEEEENKDPVDNPVENPTQDPVETPTEDPAEDPTPTITELQEFTITGVNTNLVVGQSATFSGTSGESDKYTIVRETWQTYNDNEVLIYVSSDASYNATLEAEGRLITAFEECVYYGYNVVLKFADGYKPADYMDAHINGIDYDAFLDDYDEEENIAYLYIVLRVQARNNNAQYVDGLSLSNVTKDAYIGKAPTYGAKSETEFFTVAGELWETIVIEDLGNGNYRHYIYVNATDPSFIDTEYETVFDTFDANNEYSYLIIVDSDKDHRLNYDDTSGYIQEYNVTINGEQVECGVYSEALEGGMVRYYIYVADEVVPTEAPEDNVGDNSSSSEPVATDTSYDTTYEYNNYVEETATLLAEELTEEDNKLDVKKEAKKKEQKEEEDKSNVGLIVFLVILIAIAITIPLTVYKKKQ